MISRVADHCFWFGRYLERAESTARQLQVTSALALDSDLTQLECWQPVIITAGEEERFRALCGPEAAADGEAVQEYLTYNEKVPVSLLRSVGAARENARSVREVICLEAWESINELHLWIQGPAAHALYLEHRYGFYRHVRRETQLCIGLLRAAMLHDAALDFIWLGIVLERIGQTARILDVHHHALTTARAPGRLAPSGPGARGALAVGEVAVWLSLLRACYGFEPFMKIHQGVVTGQAVASFLIFERRFPRAIRHCMRRARERLLEIRKPDSGLPALRAFARLNALEAWLDAQSAGPLGEATVHALLTRVVDETQSACDEIAVELLGAALPAPPDSPPQPVAGPSQSQSQGQTNPGPSGKGTE